MNIYNFIIENKELIKLIYGLMIAILCMIIVLRTDKLFKLSLHQGIRYFRNAFFFYAIAFIIRYIFGGLYLNFSPIHYLVIKILFEAFLIMGGFFLLYSLLWKRFEGTGKNAISSLFNVNICVFYLMTIIIVLLDVLWQTYSFMFFSQVVLFIYMAILSYLNYKDSKKQNFLKFYFIAMLLSLIAWLLNAFAALYLDWNKGILMIIYIINIIIFLLFLYGVVKVTSK